MDNVKNDAYYIEKMLKDIKFIISKTSGISVEELEENEVLCDSVLFRLIQISENAGKVSEDFKANHNEILWKAIKGMRNRIVHEYGEVKLDIVYQTITRDIPALCRKLEQFLLTEKR